jgi:hypothetical protein
VGCFTASDGHTYCLVDTNGDGVPDFGYDQGDPTTWHPIKPIDVPQRGELTPEQLAKYWANADLGHTISPAGTTPFATGTAESWISTEGLGFNPTTGGTASGLQVLDFDTSTYYADVQFYWSANFGIPNVTQYTLNHETFGLLSTISGNPCVLRIRIAGNVAEVLRYAADCGITGATFDGGSSGTYWLSIDNATSTAVLTDSNGAYSSITFR